MTAVHQAGIWRESCAVLGKNWRLVLALVLVKTSLMVPLVLMTGVFADWMKMLVHAVPEILVLYAGCNWVLFGRIRFDGQKVLKFSVRVLILKLLIMLPGQLYFLFDHGSFALLPSHVEDISRGDSVTRKSIYWIRSMTELALCCAVALFLATWLPSALGSDRDEIIQAVKRGRKTIRYTASRLFIGPVPLWLLFSFGGALLVDFAGDALIELGGGMSRLLSIVVVLGLVGATGRVWVFLLTAIVVSRAYCLAENRAAAPNMSSVKREAETQADV